MSKKLMTSAALLVGAFLLAGSLPANAQLATGTPAGAGRALGLRDGSELRPAPKDGTGFGSSFGGVTAGTGTRGGAAGIRGGVAPQGSQGSTGTSTTTRRGRG